jgi:nitroreductase
MAILCNQRAPKKKFIKYFLDLIENPEKTTQYSQIDTKVCRRCLRTLNESSAAVMIFSDRKPLSEKTFINPQNLAEKGVTITDDDVKEIISKNEKVIEDIFGYLSIGMSLQNLMLEATHNGVDTICLGSGSYFFPEIMHYFNEKNEFIMMIAMGKSIEPDYHTPRKNLNEILTILE